MFEQSTTALQKISRKKECQDMIQNVFYEQKQNMIKKEQQVINNSDEQYEQDAEWKQYDKSRWILILSEDGRWKSWTLEKLLSCAQKLKGNKLKQCKQKLQIINLIEKEMSRIQLG
eukprot:TRINITY_DN6043_c0_g1_i2.p3 TRINITY_DN6043_c0_g1~~TRINITY_DN6043_c0_g1_i2.p3  ORF type:complete len:116 (-),score=7.28 TRINITY_DN6043_c0_g1_i2:599-946(-)